jgi:hypothetical protein
MSVFARRNIIKSLDPLAMLRAQSEDAEKKEESEEAVAVWVCRHCGRECKGRLGLWNHEKACEGGIDHSFEWVEDGQDET